MKKNGLSYRGSEALLNLSFRQIKYVLEIAKTGSISAAAKQLYMDQANLSKAIKELEDLLGFRIFIRSAKGVTPSFQGKTFLEYAALLLDHMQSMEYALENTIMENESFSISIPRASYISYAFTRFMRDEQMENVEIHFQETNSMEAIDNILHHQFHLGIIRFPKRFEREFEYRLRQKELQLEVIWDFPYLVLMSKRHPLAKKEMVYIRDLQPYTELVHGDIYVPFISREDYDRTNPLHAKHNKIHVYERGSQFDLLEQVPDIYMWVSPLPQEMLKIRGLVQKKCVEDRAEFRDALICRQNYKLTDHEQRFLELLREVKEQICRENGLIASSRIFDSSIDEMKKSI